MVLLAKPIPVPPSNKNLSVLVAKKTIFKEQKESLSQEQREFALNVAKLIQYIFSKGYGCTLAEAYRTPEQAALDAKNGCGIRNSLHCKRLAIDLDLYSSTGRYLVFEEDYYQFGQYWKTLSPKNRWGGDFKRKDADHFELNPG